MNTQKETIAKNNNEEKLSDTSENNYAENETNLEPSHDEALFELVLRSNVEPTTFAHGIDEASNKCARVHACMYTVKCNT